MQTEHSPVVSVVIPVHCRTPDHELFLAEALGSVARQSFLDFETIIIDDASPRDISRIVQSVSGLPGLRTIRNSSNLGHAASRNIGIEAARGELIAFLDHDDVWLPGKLELQVAALRENPDAAMAFCQVQILGDYPQGLYIDQSTVPSRPGLAWMLSHNNPVISVSAALVRKQAMLDIGLFDGRYSSCDDFDAWIKLRRRAPILHLPHRLAVYRLHRHNVNYAVDRLNDNRLLTGLIVECLRDLSVAERLLVLPTLARKLAGRIVLRFCGRVGRYPRGSIT